MLKLYLIHFITVWLMQAKHDADVYIIKSIM